MRDLVGVLIFLVGVPLIGRRLVYGLKSGKMEAVVPAAPTYARSESPVMFWLSTTFNIPSLIGCFAFLIAAVL